MARRKADPTAMQGLLQASKEQTVQAGYQASEDPNFPVMRTPVEKRYLVYFPKTNVTVVDGVESMDLMPSLQHAFSNGNGHGFVRCIHGLEHEELGYDGTCPACSGVAEVWDLYKLKIEQHAQFKGIDPMNDKDEQLKQVKQKAGDERVLKNAERYYCFPVALIPLVGSVPAPDALETMKVEFVFWREQRYIDKIKKPLDNMFPPRPHPAGMFWVWDFNYDTKGRPANARDAARNAVFTAIDATTAQQFEPLAVKAEELAVGFTSAKAHEVVLAMQFLYKDDIDAEVGKIMSRTRSILSQIQAGGDVYKLLGIQDNTQPAQANALLNAGQGQQAQTQAQAPANLGGAPANLGGAPANLGGAPANLGGAPASAPQGAQTTVGGL